MNHIPDIRKVRNSRIQVQTVTRFVAPEHPFRVSRTFETPPASESFVPIFESDIHLTGQDSVPGEVRSGSSLARVRPLTVQLRDFNSIGPRRHRTTLRWSRNKHASCTTSLSDDRQCYYVVCFRRLPLTGEHFRVGRSAKTQGEEFAQAHMQNLSPPTSGSEVSTRVPTPNKVLGENRHAVLPPTRHLQVRPHRQLHIYAIAQPRLMCFASPPIHGPTSQQPSFRRRQLPHSWAQYLTPVDGGVSRSFQLTCPSHITHAVF